VATTTRWRHGLRLTVDRQRELNVGGRRQLHRAGFCEPHPELCHICPASPRDTAIDTAITSLRAALAIAAFAGHVPSLRMPSLRMSSLRSAAELSHV
jgi:hypothetical protein